MESSLQETVTPNGPKIAEDLKKSLSRFKLELMISFCSLSGRAVDERGNHRVWWTISVAEWTARMMEQDPVPNLSACYHKSRDF